MAVRFSIFQKSSKFHWTNIRVIHPIIICGTAFILLDKYVFHFQSPSLITTGGGLVAGAFVAGVILKIYGLLKAERLHGKLEGFVSFSPDNVQVGNEIYEIEEINKIEITNDDYYGKVNTSRSNFNFGLSNGTNNHIHIYFKDGKHLDLMYELYNPNDLQKIKHVLIGYSKKGKIEFTMLQNLLALENE